MFRPLLRTAAVLSLALVAACSRSDISAPASTVVSDEQAQIVAPEPSTSADTTEVTPETVADDPNEFFVSALVGSPDNDGQTAETPWLSLEASIARLTPGQTLAVMDGVYNELNEPGNAHYAVDVDGEEGRWITITAAPGAEPVLEASGGNAIVVRGNFIEVSGFRIRGVGFDADNAYGWGVLVRGSHHVRVADNVISDMPVGGITSVESAHLEVLYNEVYDNAFWGTEQGSGISFWRNIDFGFPPDADGYHDRVVGNIVYRNENKVFSRWVEGSNAITDGNGIILDSSDETAYEGRALVANNVVFDNGGRGILVFEQSHVDMIHNTTFRNGRTENLAGGPVELGIRRSDDVRVFNNLAWARPGVNPLQIDEVTNIVGGGNLLVADSSSGDITELDTLTVQDPGLVAPAVDPAIADFRPLPGSLALGHGIPISPALPFDADGTPRSSARIDAGAYTMGDDAEG